MDDVGDFFNHAYLWLYERIPHHPVFLIAFAVFTLFKIYCTICVIIEHIKIRNYEAKIVLIIGCEEKSFGRLLAVKCAKKGMHVLATSRTTQGLLSLKAATVNGKGTITGYLMDPADEASVLEMKMRIQDEFISKNNDLHAIVNFPGSLTVGYDDELTLEDYQKHMSQNFYSLVRIVHAFKPMLKKSRGRIINFSSVYGKFAIPGLGPHCISDACVEAYSDLLRRELEPFGVKTIVVQGGFLKGANQVTESIKETWSRIPRGTGLDSSEEYRQKVLNCIRSKENSVFHCPPECWTTACLFNAIVSAFPRRRYVIGFANLIFYTPISLVPANFQDLFFHLYWFLAWFPGYVECAQKQKNIDTIES